MTRDIIREQQAVLHLVPALESTADGYVVSVWLYDSKTGVSTLRPLANFGDNQSAAIEFRDYLRKYRDRADFERRILLQAGAYKRTVKYSYPRITPSGLYILPRQKRYE
ncbi:MAG: hypothetical protein NC209_04155 [Alistipes sp.]|nr:hypothetical protein [Lachnospiraceae bacterium]MCM1250323.1 hypothetical protein [Alistipes sp.]